MKQYRVKIYKSATALVDATYAAASSGEAADAAVKDLSSRAQGNLTPVWSCLKALGKIGLNASTYVYANVNGNLICGYVLSVEVTEVEVTVPNNELEQLLQSINALTLEVKRKQQELTDKYKQLRKLMRAG